MFYEGYKLIKHQWIIVLYLRELHLHVGKDMEESHNRVPQTTVSQTLLVSSTRSLDDNSDNVSCIILNILTPTKSSFRQIRG